MTNFEHLNWNISYEHKYDKIHDNLTESTSYKANAPSARLRSGMKRALYKSTIIIVT